MEFQAACAHCWTVLDLPAGQLGALIRCGRCLQLNRIRVLVDGRIALAHDPSEGSAGAPLPDLEGAAAVFRAPSHDAAEPLAVSSAFYAPSGNFMWGALTIVPPVTFYPYGFLAIPFGIASILAATKVHGAWMAGQPAAAKRADVRARNLGLIGILLPIVVQVMAGSG